MVGALGAVMALSTLRTEKLDLRLTSEAKQTLQRAAAVAKRSVTDFVLESALASAAETLADRQSFQLEPEQWQAFVAAIDAPPKVHWGCPNSMDRSHTAISATLSRSAWRSSKAMGVE